MQPSPHQFPAAAIVALHLVLCQTNKARLQGWQSKHLRRSKWGSLLAVMMNIAASLTAGPNLTAGWNSKHGIARTLVVAGR